MSHASNCNPTSLTSKTMHRLAAEQPVGTMKYISCPFTVHISILLKASKRLSSLNWKHKLSKRDSLYSKFVNDVPECANLIIFLSKQILTIIKLPAIICVQDLFLYHEEHRYSKMLTIFNTRTTKRSIDRKTKFTKLYHIS